MGSSGSYWIGEVLSWLWLFGVCRVGGYEEQLGWML